MDADQSSEIYELPPRLRKRWISGLVQLTIIPATIWAVILFNLEIPGYQIFIAAIAWFGALAAVWALALTMVFRVSFSAGGSIRFERLSGAVTLRPEQILRVKRAPLSTFEAVLTFDEGRLNITTQIQGWNSFLERVKTLNENVNVDV